MLGSLTHANKFVNAINKSRRRSVFWQRWRRRLFNEFYGTLTFYSMLPFRSRGASSRLMNGKCMMRKILKITFFLLNSSALFYLVVVPYATLVISLLGFNTVFHIWFMGRTTKFINTWRKLKKREDGKSFACKMAQTLKPFTDEIYL